MKRFICFFSFLISFLGFSQKEASIWYFGNHAGLDFNSGSPIALTDGQLETDEGCAVISDNNGKLLFYTDGSDVYNKQHQIMANGTGLNGHYSSTNSAIIVPQPNNNNGYYIFTVDAEFGANGLQYSKVDMSLDNNLGAITTKNQLLETPVTEKLTAIKIPGKNAYWVIAHRGHSNEFIVYKITSDGISLNPIISVIGPDISWPPGNSQGQMKLSPDGKKLAVATQSQGFELYDFDINTGKISNFQQLKNDWSCYGVEFSPNGKLLYVSSGNFGVEQYNLDAGSLAEIINSKVQLLDDNTTWGLQLAIDGKIYAARSLQSDALDVIKYPNRQGLACEYTIRDIDLGGKNSYLGLPPFIQSYFYINGINAENFCLGEITKFSVTTSSKIGNIAWDFGDGSSSNEESPAHQYNNPGTYTVTVKVNSEGEIDVETREIVISPKAVAHIPKDVSICSSDGNFNFDLHSKDNEVTIDQKKEDFNIEYFATLNDAEVDENPLPYSISQNQNISDSIYIRLSSKENLTCYDITAFKFSIIKEPTLKEVSNWEVCDPSAKFIFDLSQKDSEVLGNQNSDLFEIHYFETEENAFEDKNSIEFVEKNTSNDVAPIFFRIQNKKNKSCYQIGEFSINVLESISLNSSVNIYSCDLGNGLGSFSTSQWKESIVANPENYQFSFFSSTGAELGYPLAETYNNIIPYTDKVRVEVIDIEKPSCVGKAEINLVVNKHPQWNLKDEYTVCGVEPSLTLNCPTEFDSYEWKYEDGTIISSSSLVILNKPGTYSFHGGKIENGILCESDHTIEFFISDLPQIQEIKSNDWADNNTIEIIASGEGSIEYSLDGLNFQDSNYFDNLEGGLFTVYARDKDGCGMDQQQITIIDYPKFFTPNQDGYNDLWQIEGIENYPEATCLIFDRYGKLLKKLQAKDKGWNGYFNGALMPEDDYWFLLKIPDGRSFKNHFTLMR